MTARLLLLELRRNRLSALSAGLAFLATLPVCRLVSASTGLEPRLALDAALTAWLLFGTPLAAALIGAASGSAAASSEAVEAEALLPLSAGRRAAASILVAILLTAGFASFLLSASAILGGGSARAWSLRESLPFASFLAAASLDVLAGAWALSRLLGNGVAGGLLALPATVAASLAFTLAVGFEVEHAGWGFHARTAVCLIAVSGILAKLAAGGVAARVRERRAGPAGLALAVALVVACPVLAWGPLLRELAALDGCLHLAEPAPVHRYQSYDESFPRGARARAAAGEELAFATARDGVVAVGPRGIRELIPESSVGFWSLLFSPFSGRLRGVMRDPRGVFWASRWQSEGTEVWRIEGGRAVKRLNPPGDGGTTDMLGGVPVKYRYFDGRTLSVARLDDYFERGDRARWSKGIAAFVEENLRAAHAARIACDGRCLRVGGRSWTLPGRALSSRPVYPDDIGGQAAYLVPVRTGKGLQVALCRDDGSVAIAWPLRADPGYWPNYHALPDGSLSAFGPEWTLWSLDPSGKQRRPFPLGALLREQPLDARHPARGRVRNPDVVRFEGERAWLVWRGSLVVVDADGRAVSTRSLPSGVESAVGMKDGFVALSPRAAYFIDWDGGVRTLRKP